jgi:pimeloyl-ACP methyl ester carboxylesterase
MAGKHQPECITLRYNTGHHSIGDLDLRPVLGKIKMPVAIFHGVNDKLCDYAQAEQLNKAIKGSYHREI